MLSKTRGIVLHKIKYSDTSVIVHLYTEDFGKQVYLIKGAFSKKAKLKSVLFQPLTLLEIETVYRSNKNFQTLKEVKAEPLLLSISGNIIKSSIALFMAEILYKVLIEESGNKEKFEFLFNTIQLLDLSDHGINNFHLSFLIKFSKYLGFYPNNNYSQVNKYFDLINGSFVQFIPSHNHYLTEDLSELLSNFMNGMNGDHVFKLSNKARLCLLENLIDYYRIHVENLGSIKALSVLNDVFHS